MPEEKTKKLLCVDNIRHAEYYGLQEKFDELYRKSMNGDKFANLMDLILSRENILLAYRNIKTNTGSNTAGTDRLTIKDIGCLSAEEVVERTRFIVQGSKHGYRPKPVRRKEIPKPNGKTRPLGIPCIWDRLIQQCIKQVMEPICEAKFSNNSYGFRPNRSVENAISATYNRLQLSHCHYVIEFDIKGFFDNVNHSKLLKQIWAMGIEDKHLIYVIGKILKAPIKMPNGQIIQPQKGTPQGGIISPLLANIVLNELDHWVESNWENNPHVDAHWKICVQKDGKENKSTGYRWMRTYTHMKEMYIVRYADDFRVFCKTRADAEKTKIAITQWLSERLRLEVSEEKTRIVNVNKQYSEFLGFKIKLQDKGHKKVVKSNVSDKQLQRKKEMLIEQAKRIGEPRKEKGEVGEIQLFNSMVMGLQNYYRIATDVNLSFRNLNKSVMTILTNRLATQRGNRLEKTGRKLSAYESKRYGSSAMLRYIAGTGQPVYPIGYVQHKNPMGYNRKTNVYTKDGRIGIHDNLRINTALMLQLMRSVCYIESVEYADNRISLFSAQWGKCAVSDREFQTTDEIHCHHIVPKSRGGTDRYENLVLVTSTVHKLIHATDAATINRYLNACNLDSKQLKKLNQYRKSVGNAEITTK